MPTRDELDLRNSVREQARDRCEYCQIRQDQDAYYEFHLEHITARQHGGRTEETNLAWSCHHCNLHKGPNLTGIDPRTNEITPLFNPRRDRWEKHFRWDGPILVGRTATGRTTIAVLQINNDDRVELRQVLIDQGLFPPKPVAGRPKKPRRST